MFLGKGGERQYNGLIDVYRKTLATDGIQGLYRGFVISAVGIFIYRGFYFGLYDSLKPILLPADAGFLASFTLGYSKYWFIRTSPSGEWSTLDPDNGQKD